MTGKSLYNDKKGDFKMLHTILTTLFWILFFVWCIWFVAYPIYIKVKHKTMNWSIYALLLSIAALLINIINLFIKITS